MIRLKQSHVIEERMTIRQLTNMKLFDIMREVYMVKRHHMTEKVFNDSISLLNIMMLLKRSDTLLDTHGVGAFYHVCPSSLTDFLVVEQYTERPLHSLWPGQTRFLYKLSIHFLYAEDAHKLQLQ